MVFRWPARGLFESVRVDDDLTNLDKWQLDAVYQVVDARADAAIVRRLGLSPEEQETAVRWLGRLREAVATRPAGVYSSTLVASPTGSFVGSPLPPDQRAPLRSARRLPPRALRGSGPAQPSSPPSPLSPRVSDARRISSPSPLSPRASQAPRTSSPSPLSPTS